jgi:hypothetical protein
MFWLIWLLVGCQLVWTAFRAFAAPWTWNPYQCLTLVALLCLPVGLISLGLIVKREGLDGFKARIAAFEAHIETPRIALRWNLAFWIVAAVLAVAYFNMEKLI